MDIPVPSAGPKVLSISELTQEIKTLFEEGFPTIWVTGEVSNLSRPTSGHVYLTLKDGSCQLRAVIWRSVVLRLRYDLCDGMEVIASGKLSVYGQRGEYQMLVERIEPKGIGAQEVALRQLKEKLFRLGYFDPNRKKPLPAFPRRLALVTSPSGAAVRDMLEILGRRWPGAEVWIYPVRVQGEGAAEEITAAIQLLNKMVGIDVMIVGRGGGSLEDLWAFNEECVARAIFFSRIPVVSAVGHEIDVTIADLVADRRALTPSEAAERAVPNRVDLLEGLKALEERLRDLLRNRYFEAKKRVDEFSQRRVLCHPLEGIREHERRLDEWGGRMERAIRLRVGRQREGIVALAARLESLSPLNVLGRGYSLTRRFGNQAVLRSSDQIRPGDRLVTFLKHGQIVSRVEEENPTHPFPDSKGGQPSRVVTT